MLTIYKNKKYVSKQDRIKIVHCISGYFAENFIGKIELNDLDKQIIKHIGENGDLEKLTDGSKFLLLINHSKELGNPILDFDGINTFLKPTEEVMDFVWLISKGNIIKGGLLSRSIYSEANDGLHYVYVNENGANVKDDDTLISWRSGMRKFF